MPEVERAPGPLFSPSVFPALLLALFPYAQQEPTPLTVEEAARLAAVNAPATRQAGFAALAARYGIREAAGAFDPVFFADSTWAYADRPASGFQGDIFATSETNSLRGEQGIRAALMSGGSLSLSLREDYSDSTMTEVIGSFSDARTESDLSLNFAFTQPLLRGAWALTATQGLRSAELGFRQSLASLNQAALDGVQQAVEAYWDLAFALEDVEVKKFSLKLAEELRDVTRARFEVGSVAEVELVQTEADIASREDALLTARNTVHQAQDGLRLLLYGLEEDEEWGVVFETVSVPPTPVPAEVSWEAALKESISSRPDLKSFRFQVAEKELAWKVAQEGIQPKLDMVAAGNFYGQDDQVGAAFSSMADWDFPGFSFGLNLEIPFANAALSGAERRAWNDYRLAVRQLRDQENEVARATRDAVRGVDYLAERVAATRKASQVAERQLEAEQRRLREGASTNFQVLQFQEDLVSAQTAEAGARMGYAKAVALLNTVRGRNWNGEKSSPARIPEEN